MAYKIIGDSCCDFSKAELESGLFESVPMSIIIDGVEYPDNKTKTQEEWIGLVKNSEGCPGSACPSPDAFYNAYDENKDNYVVTISAKLSGVYNSASIAKEMFLEDHEDAHIHIFDSQSAACGEHLICEKIAEAVEKGLSFEEVVEEVEAFRDEMLTVFVLDDLETFKKNGRLSGIKAVVATTMNIKPVLIGDKGEIKQQDQAIGIHKAVNRMLYFLEKQNISRDRKVRISECGSKDLCVKVAGIMKERFGFTDIKIIRAGGLTTIYENPGGIVIAL